MGDVSKMNGPGNVCTSLGILILLFLGPLSGFAQPNVTNVKLPNGVRAPKIAVPAPATALSQNPKLLNLASAPIPKYLRIEVDGYHIRSSPDFRHSRTDNIDFKTKKGAVYAILSTEKTRTGTAVKILVGDKERWIFIPHWRKQDFPICESEDCFASKLTRTLEVLESLGVSPAQLASSCGLILRADGGVEDISLPSIVGQNPPPPSRTIPQAQKNAAALSPEARRLSLGSDQSQLETRPTWEIKKGARGAMLTGLLRQSLRKFGKNLLESPGFKDQAKWCPKFSWLSASQKEEFWIHLMVGKSMRESDFREMTTFDEVTRRNVRSGPVSVGFRRYSQGLFALSYADVDSYPKSCRMDRKKDADKDVSDPSLTIYDPQIQMDCAVGILSHNFSRGNAIAQRVGYDRKGRPIYEGGGKYWSTFREENPASRLVRENVKKFKPCW